MFPFLKLKSAFDIWLLHLFPPKATSLLLCQVTVTYSACRAVFENEDPTVKNPIAGERARLHAFVLNVAKRTLLRALQHIRAMKTRVFSMAYAVTFRPGAKERLAGSDVSPGVSHNGQGSVVAFCICRISLRRK